MSRVADHHSSSDEALAVAGDKYISEVEVEDDGQFTFSSGGTRL
jgi:hypothetical protein